VLITQVSINVEPDSSIEKNFKFAPGDTIFVMAEAIKQELVQNGTNDILDLTTKILEALQKPTVNSVLISEYEGETFAQAGDSQKVELKYFTPTGGPFSIIFKNTSSKCRKTYNIKLYRIPAQDSLISFDTRLAAVRIDTLIESVLDKTCYLPAGEISFEQFTIPTSANKLVIIVSNEESYNALTTAVGSNLLSLVVQEAFGIPLPFDISSFKTGKNFGYSIDYFNPNLQIWSHINPETRTVLESRSIDLTKYKYENWKILLDNSFSIMTSKQVKLQIHTVTVKPIYR
jgi:hypothetical protein